MRCTRMTSTPLSSTLLATLCVLRPHGRQFDRRVVPLLATLTVAGMVFFDLLSRRVRNLWRASAGGRSYQGHWCCPPGAQKRGDALRLRQPPLAASMTDSSNFVPPSTAGQVLAVQLHVICASADVGNEGNGALSTADVGQQHGERSQPPRQGRRWRMTLMASCWSRRFANHLRTWVAAAGPSTASTAVIRSANSRTTYTSAATLVRYLSWGHLRQPVGKPLLTRYSAPDANSGERRDNREPRRPAGVGRCRLCELGSGRPSRPGALADCLNGHRQLVV